MVVDADPVMRQRILAALAQVVAQEGYGACRVTEIARTARISLRSFYREFENKEAAFLALHTVVVETVTATVEEAVVFDLPWRQVIHRAYVTYFELLTAQPKLTHAFLVELATLSEQARASRERAMQRFTTMLIDLVEAGRQANPDVPSHPLNPLIARGLLGAVLELVTSRAINGDLTDLTELAEVSTDMLWSTVTRGARN